MASNHSHADDDSTTDISRRGLIKTVGAGVAGTALVPHFTGSATAEHGHVNDYDIRVNRIGYPLDDRKLAVLPDDDGAVVGNVGEFDVVDVESGTRTTVSASAADTDIQGSEGGEISGHQYVHLDFTDAVSSAGTYRLEASTGSDTYESPTFAVGDPADIYADLFTDVGRLYTLHRANADISDAVTGLDIGPGHVDDYQDTNAEIAQLKGNATLASDFGISSNSGYTEGDRVDVTGGWYDAGDYGKYTVNLAVTAAQLLLAYERNPEVFEAGQFGIDGVAEVYDSNGSAIMPNLDPDTPDILAEIRYGLTFLENMQVDGDGLVFFKVGPGFPAMDVLPGEHTTDGDPNSDAARRVLGVSSAATAMAGAVFAMAARVFRAEGEDSYAERLEGRADDAWTWLQNNRPLGGGTVWHQSVGQDESTGPYGRAPPDSDANHDGVVDEDDESYWNPDLADLYWFAAEMMRLKDDQTTYEQYITGDADSPHPDAGNDSSPESLNDYYYQRNEMPITVGVAEPIDWDNPISLGHYAYYMADGDQAGDYLSGPRWPPDSSNNADDQWGLISNVWMANDRTARSAYPMNLWTYYWGGLKSGLSRGTIMQMAADAGGDDLYAASSIGSTWTSNYTFNTSNMLSFSKAPLHGVLGRHATGSSYVTGYGELSPEDPHHRIQNSTGILPPGMLVGGPHNTPSLWEEAPTNPDTNGDDSTYAHLGQPNTAPNGGLPHAMAYQDDLHSYATNEWAINYTAPLLFLLAEICDTAPQREFQTSYPRLHTLPTRIEAENFDRGGPGVAYNDSFDYNHVYRTDTEVAIGAHDGFDDYHIGAVNTGDWWEYTVLAPEDSVYRLDVQLGPDWFADVDVAIDGEPAGQIRARPNGSYRDWEVFSVFDIELDAGVHTVRLTAGEESRFDIDWLEFVEDPGVPTLPARLQAEDFDDGPAGDAYHNPGPDHDAGYRDSEVAIYETPNDDGYHVGDLDDGEWWEYTVEVPERAEYYFSARYAADGNGSHIELLEEDGSVLMSSHHAGDTGGTEQWDYLYNNLHGMYLHPGEKTIRVQVGSHSSMSAPTYVLDWISLDHQAPNTGWFSNPRSVPGRIQAEDFDIGGDGRAYSQSASADPGYRENGEGALGEHANGHYHVTDVESGDWWEYSVLVDQDGSYGVDVRLGAPGAAEVDVLVDGEPLETLTTAGTGGYRSWSVLSGNASVALEEGPHEVRLEAGSNADFDLDWFEVVSQ